jgi:hypothetical protein
VNPFVNFKKRDFLLPKGCKDLGDLLTRRTSQRNSSASSSAAPFSEERAQGSLEDVEGHVRRFLDSTHGVGSLIISASDRNVSIDLDSEGVTIGLMIPIGPEEQAVRAFFSQQGLQSRPDLQHVDSDSLLGGGVGTVCQILDYEVPRNVERLGQIVRDLFVKVFSITRETQMFFAEMKF